MNNDPKNGKYIVKRLNADNLTDVEKLHTAVYDKQQVKGFFMQKYNTAFTGIEHTGFIAYNNEQMPVAFYGVIPCFIKIDDKIILSAQSADTMTHPGYRNQGLFVELALTTFQLCRELDIKLIFGFPNKNSLPGFVNKLGWQVTDTMDCFIIHTRNFSLDGILNKVPLLKKLHTGYQSRILKKYLVRQNGITNSVFTNGFGGVYRDKDFLNYKTYNPTQVIRIDDATLWIKISSVLLIGDILLNPDNFDDMMYKLKKLARRLGIKEIHFHASPGTTLHGLFAMRFNSFPSFPVIFKDQVESITLDKIKFTSVDIDTF